jgi:hypothetical protein|tara:strand:+ start:29991 stop:30902 length:912 start_codon:yes stop_codon:yes gene_type:complete
MAIFRQGKRVGPFDIRLGLPRGREYDNIPGDPRIKQRANPETTVNRFRGALSTGEGVARGTRFLVNITLPSKIQTDTRSGGNFEQANAGNTANSNNVDMAQQVALMCTNITMPARTLNTSPYRIAGAPYKYPTSVQYSDVTATFIGDKFLRLRNFFEEWQALVYDNQTGMFNFYKEYTAPIDVFQLGSFQVAEDRDRATYGIRMREAFPSAIGEVNYDSGTQNSYVAITVTFSYRDWLNFDLDIDSTGKVGGLSSGEVKPGGGFLNGLPPELRRTGRDVLNGLKRSIPIGKVFGGKIFPPLTF